MNFLKITGVAAGFAVAGLLSAGAASAAPGVHVNVNGNDVVKWGNGASARSTQGNSAVAINFGRGSSAASAQEGTGNVALAIQNSYALKERGGDGNIAVAAFGGQASTVGTRKPPPPICLNPFGCSTTYYDAGDDNLAIAIGPGASAADLDEGNGNRAIALGTNARAVTSSNIAGGNVAIAMAESEAVFSGVDIGDDNVSFAQCGASLVTTSGTGQVRTQSGNCL